MRFVRSMKPLLSIALGTLLLLTACTSAPSKYDQVQQETTGAGVGAVNAQAQAGGTFNSFFPSSEGSYEVVPAQEKTGFAEYKLKQDGKTIAMLSINDTISVPAAAAKYDSPSETIAGYPAVQQGATATGILVNGRYQVKVLSRDDAFTAEDRATWLQKFDLQGLSQLEAATPVSPRADTPPILPEAPAPAAETAPVGAVPQPVG